ncbi:DUF2231 domain-containing protein [Microvirga sp. TS319]|uniref:DUF2231 domain-containing protein n=1 Tax=Microvirga sp. TS319 TaxID=3241165 RepID=UPI00351AA84B
MSNPVVEEVERHDVSSAVAVAGHPVHAMLVTFPIAFTVGTLAADVLYWWWGDAFWARAALWSSGAAFMLGVIAGLVGTAELVLVKGIRKRAASWTHAIAAMMLIAIIGTNWGLRISDHEAAVLPTGLFLSALGMVFVGIAGWHGGKLVFEHQIGLMLSEND